MIAFWVFLLSPVLTGFVTAHELRPAVGDLTIVVLRDVQQASSSMSSDVPMGQPVNDSVPIAMGIPVE